VTNLKYLAYYGKQQKGIEMSKELIDALEKALVELTKNAIPSYKPPLDDGWIRHTGDVCPVHPRDKVLYTAGGVKYDVEFYAGSICWDGITHYKVVKAYDPHAENKALYAKDALTHKEPWTLWEISSVDCNDFRQCTHSPHWSSYMQYRRKQTKKLVDWSCPLLKGANTNYGELYEISKNSGGNHLARQQMSVSAHNLRLLPPIDDKSNWKAYNGDDLNLLHEAGFVVELQCVNGSLGLERYEWAKVRPSLYLIAHYRVIGIRDGFTYAKEVL
jgi:hypothetical protein